MKLPKVPLQKAPKAMPPPMNKMRRPVPNPIPKPITKSNPLPLGGGGLPRAKRPVVGY